jgi:hypothetical protein
LTGECLLPRCSSHCQQRLQLSCSMNTNDNILCTRYAKQCKQYIRGHQRGLSFSLKRILKKDDTTLNILKPAQKHTLHCCRTCKANLVVTTLYAVITVDILIKTMNDKKRRIHKAPTRKTSQHLIACRHHNFSMTARALTGSSWDERVAQSLQYLLQWNLSSVGKQCPSCSLLSRYLEALTQQIIVQQLY